MTLVILYSYAIRATGHDCVKSEDQVKDKLLQEADIQRWTLQLSIHSVDSPLDYS